MKIYSTSKNRVDWRPASLAHVLTLCGALLSEAGAKVPFESKDILACPRFSGWPYAGQGWQPTPSRLRPLLR